jgi:uncharacterized membrane protein
LSLRRATLVSLILLTASAAVGLYGWIRLPPGILIAVHFDAHGRANGFAPKTFGLTLMPAVGALVLALLRLLPAIVPKRSALLASAASYGATMMALQAVFLATQAALVAHAFDPAFDVLSFTTVAVGLLLVVVGNVLGKVRHNFVFGVRTPWTLASERVWDKTHRFTGRLMVAAGALLAIGGAFAPKGGVQVALMVACAAGPALAGTFWSWRLYQNESREG